MSAQNSAGIQTLLDSEKEAQKIVQKAREYRTKRVKDAKAEAQKEIEEYRQKKEEDFKKFESEQSSGNKKAEQDANKDAETKVKEIEQAGKKSGSKVVEDLIKAVTTPRPEAPEKIDAYSLADPISIITLAGSVIAVCYQYGCAVADAPKEARQLSQEISNLNALLVSALGLSQTSSHLHLSDALVNCKDALEKVSQRLERHDHAEEQSRQRRAINRLRWPLDKKMTLELLTDIGRQKANLSLALDIVVAENTTAVQEQLFHLNESLDGVVRELKDSKTSVEFTKVLNWLSKSRPDEQQRRIAELRTDHTCSWITEHAAFKSWLKADRGLLYLSGMAGSGKTISTSYVVTTLAVDQATCALFGFFYFDANLTTHTSLSSLIGSLLRQMCKERMPGLIHDAYMHATKQSSETAPIPLQRLKSMFLDVLHQEPRARIVVDGVDEADDPESICEWLMDLSQLGFCKVQVFVTGRPFASIRNALKDGKEFEAPETSVQGDIGLYITQVLLRSSRLRRLSKDIKESIRQILLAKSGGMFRWVQCQLDEISKLRTEAAIKKALTCLPKTLEESYCQILGKVSVTDVEFARRILLWLVYTPIPLNLRLLADAIAVERDADRLDPALRLDNPLDIIDICGAFVAYSEPESPVRLIHHSVRDYLCSSLQDGATFCLPHQRSQRELAVTCLTYLLMDDFREFEPDSKDVSTVLEEYSFFQYAARFWPVHVAQSGAEKELQPLILRLMTPLPNEAFLFWISVVVHLSASGPYHNFRPRPLYYAASWGLEATARSLLRQGAGIDDQAGGYQGTALHAACFRGHPKVLRLLLEHGADVFIRDVRKMTVFHMAEWCERPEIIEILLDHVEKTGLSTPKDVDLPATLSRLRAEQQAKAPSLYDKVLASANLGNTDTSYVEIHGQGLFREAVNASAASDTGTMMRRKHPAGSSTKGWWRCCECKTPQNPSLSPDSCSICGHLPCLDCEASEDLTRRESKVPREEPRAAGHELRYSHAEDDQNLPRRPLRHYLEAARARGAAE